MVFEGSTRVYKPIREIEISEFEMHLKNFFVCHHGKAMSENGYGVLRFGARFS